MTAYKSTYMRKALILQVFFISVGFVFSVWYDGLMQPLALLFGGGVAITSTLLMIWRAARCKLLDPQDVQRHLRSLYFSFVERMVAVIGLLILGFGPLAIEPRGLLTGFVMGQTALILTGFIDRKK